MKSRFSLLSLTLLLAGTALTANAASYFIYPFEKSPEAGADQTERLAKQFLGSSVEVVHRTDDTLYLASAKDGSTHLEHNVVTGEFRFERGFSRYLGDFAPKLPSADEAVKLSQEFLKQNGVLPAVEAELKVAHVGGLRAQNVLKSGRVAGPIVDKLVTVTFSRLVDGLPVVGPGSRLVVNLGDGAEVVSLARQWREVDVKGRKEVSEKEVLTEDEVYALAKRQILSEFGEDALFEIRGKGPGYYDNNGGILQPVFILETHVISRDDGVVPANYLCIIPLLRESPEPLNLTALDPKAKELIKTGRPILNPPTRPIGD